MKPAMVPIDLAFEAWWLHADGFKLHAVKFCRDCGERLWFWRCFYPRHWQYKVKPKQGRVYPFDFASTRLHECAAAPKKANRGNGFATRRPSGQGENQAGSGRDEPVVRMPERQAGEQVTRRAEPQATPPLSAFDALFGVH